MNGFIGSGCGSFPLVMCRVGRKLWLQVWYLICSYVGEGVVFVGLVSLTSSPYSSELLVPGRGFICLQGFAMCAQAWDIWFSVGESWPCQETNAWLSNLQASHSLYQVHYVDTLSTCLCTVCERRESKGYFYSFATLHSPGRCLLPVSYTTVEAWNVASFRMLQCK